jgi:hypothetical protein
MYFLKKISWNLDSTRIYTNKGKKKKVLISNHLNMTYDDLTRVWALIFWFMKKMSLCPINNYWRENCGEVIVLYFILLCTLAVLASSYHLLHPKKNKKNYSVKYHHSSHLLNCFNKKWKIKVERVSYWVCVRVLRSVWGDGWSGCFLKYFFI